MDQVKHSHRPNPAVAAALLVSLASWACSDAENASTEDLDATPADLDASPDHDDAADMSDADGFNADASLDATTEPDRDGADGNEINEDGADGMSDADTNVILCPGGASECPSGLGCVDGRCAPCAGPQNCLAHDACHVDGSCGACGLQAECDGGEVCQDGFCLPEAIPLWSLTIDPDDWAAINADLQSQSFVPCVLSADGVDYADGCKVRLHGGSSLWFPKRSFRVTFPAGVDQPGLTRKITLRSEYNDPSFMRNRLSFEAFRHLTSLPTPETRYVRLALNGEYYGLFLEVERIGRPFLKAHGRSDQSSLYEADPPLALARLGAGGLIPLPDEATYRGAYDRKIDSAGDISDLVTLVEDVIWLDYLDGQAGGSPTGRIREAIDVDGFIDYLALMGVLQNHDHVRKNYYFSWQTEAGTERRRWEFYPWDLDLSFGCFWDETDDVLCTRLYTDRIHDCCGLRDGITAGYPAKGFYNLLISQVLDDPELRARFESRICEMLASDFWAATLPALIDATDAHIRAAVMADANDQSDAIEEFEAEVAEIRTFMAVRTALLTGLLACNP